MKQKILIATVLVLMLSGNILAGQTETNQLPLAFEPGYQDCYDPMLEPNEVLVCRLSNYCTTLWLAQPVLESFLIPYWQGQFRNDKTCGWYRFGIIADSVFWLPLACICNGDPYGCITWTYDFLYNLISSYMYCR